MDKTIVTDVVDLCIMKLMSRGQKILSAEFRERGQCIKDRVKI